jgi:formate dehydrogenase subunit gamma
MTRRRIGSILAGFSLVAAILVLAVTMTGLLAFPGPVGAQAVRPPANAVGNDVPPPAGATAPSDAAGALAPLGAASDSDLWRAVREGDRFTVTIPDRQGAVLVQSEGNAWRQLREGPMLSFGMWALGGTLAVLALFYLLRGRIRIEHGKAGVTIRRFSAIERFGHWLLAISFIILGLTGLAMLYGRPVLIPVVGKQAFAAFMAYGKIAHNLLGFAFMAGLALTFVTWVAHNLPGRHDITWLLKAGGLFSKNVHPHARKFNAGQKIIFWSTMLLGVSLSLSGIALLFPFELHLFGKTFAALNVLGLNLPTELTPLQETQLSQLWHAAISLVMMAVILAHIYIGTLGMEGAFDAMGSGQVDLNWAREHHDLWVEEVALRHDAPHGAATPAE